MSIYVILHHDMPWCRRNNTFILCLFCDQPIYGSLIKILTAYQLLHVIQSQCSIDIKQLHLYIKWHLKWILVYYTGISINSTLWHFVSVPCFKVLNTNNWHFSCLSSLPLSIHHFTDIYVGWKWNTPKYKSWKIVLQWDAVALTKFIASMTSLLIPHFLPICLHLCVTCIVPYQSHVCNISYTVLLIPMNRLACKCSGTS